MPIVLIFLFATAIRLYMLPDLAPFIGDQAWFFLSAREMIETGDIPLVGITASRTWLHQGPWWTYVLGVILYLTDYNPIAPAYATVLLDSAVAVLVCVVAARWYGTFTGLLAGVLYAASPLIIMNSRMAYHTSLIPIFALGALLYMVQWVRKKKNALPLLIFFLTSLYAINLSSTTVWFVFGALVLIGFLYKQQWFHKSLTPSTLFASVIIGSIPVIPFFLYDLQHMFAQTILFPGVLMFRPLFVFLNPGYYNPQPMIDYFFNASQHMLFLSHSGVGAFLATLVYLQSLIWVIRAFRNRKWDTPEAVMGIYVLIVVGAVAANGTPSHANLYVLFPVVPVILARVLIAIRQVFSGLIRNISGTSFAFKALPAILVIVIALMNMYALMNNSYLVDVDGGYGVSMYRKKHIAREMIRQSGSLDYDFEMTGPGSGYDSYRMPFDYLTWYYGKAPDRSNPDILFTIYEGNGDISLETASEQTQQ